MFSSSPAPLPPADIVAAAEQVGRWFAEHNIAIWALGPCQSRATGTPQAGRQLTVPTLPGLSHYDRELMGLKPTGLPRRFPDGWISDALTERPQ